MSSYFDRFREITKATNRVALLWLGALIIVWYTGLERTYREANESFVSLQINNTQKQKFENQIHQEHQKFVQANLDAQLFTQHQNENQNRAEYNQLLQQAQRSGNQDDVRRYTKIIKQIDLRLTPPDKLPSAERAEAEAVQQVEKQLQASVKLAEELKRNQESKAKQYQENQLAILRQYQELREQRKGVNFEILNQKFEVPPLYAALIWSVFLTGLILYVARARFILLSLSADVLSHPQNQATSERHLKGEAPWWLAPLPRLQLPAAPKGDSPGKADAAQLYRFFNWENGNRTATLLVMLGLLSLTLLQVRVVWLELMISRLIGTTQQRALVPVIATAVLFLTFFTIWLWLRFRRLSLSRPQQTNTHRVRPAYLISTLIIVGVFVFLFVFMERHISRGLSYERGLKTSLVYISVLLILELTVICLYEWFRPWPTAPAGEKVAPAGLVNRRWFLYAGGVFAVIGSTGIVRAFANSKKKQRRVRTRRPDGIRASYRKRSIKKRLKRKNEPRQVVNLKPGFYRNPKTKIVHFVSKNGFVLGVTGSKIKAERLQEFLPDSAAARGVNDSGPPVAVTETTPGSRPRQSKARVEGNLAVPEISRQAMPARSENAHDNRPTLFRRFPFPAADQSFSMQDFVAKPRVNLSTASQAFDEAVVSILALNRSTHKDHEAICDLLAFAINHDLMMKGKLGHPPSLRLYDLLAGMSVRYNRPDYLDYLVRIIENSNNADIFQSRIRKWQDTGSSWYRRWSNSRQQITWSKVKFS